MARAKSKQLEQYPAKDVIVTCINVEVQFTSFSIAHKNDTLFFSQVMIAV